MANLKSIHGSCLSFPFRVDARGSLATVSDPEEMARQFLTDLIETRLYERVLVPDYGTTDPAFQVADAGWLARLAYELEEQVKDYLPIISSISVRPGFLENGDFIQEFSLDQQRVALLIIYTIRGSNTPHNMVYPGWQLRPEITGS
ncbi:MAG TPA: hypothetical protein VF717_09255 [Pyrinomonadaceae bacterium]|jgi:phage baseplate assembly protein W